MGYRPPRELIPPAHHRNDAEVSRYCQQRGPGRPRAELQRKKAGTAHCMACRSVNPPCSEGRRVAQGPPNRLLPLARRTSSLAGYGPRPAGPKEAGLVRGRGSGKRNRGVSELGERGDRSVVAVVEGSISVNHLGGSPATSGWMTIPTPGRPAMGQRFGLA